MIEITGLPKARILMELYRDAKCLGMGILHYREGCISENEANDLLKTHTHFDYLHGRVIKVKFSGESFEEFLYDRDNGNGAAARCVDRVRAEIQSARK